MCADVSPINQISLDWLQSTVGEGTRWEVMANEQGTPCFNGNFIPISY